MKLRRRVNANVVHEWNKTMQSFEYPVLFQVQEKRGLANTACDSYVWTNVIKAVALPIHDLSHCVTVNHHPQHWFPLFFSVTRKQKHTHSNPTFTRVLGLPALLVAAAVAAAADEGTSSLRHPCSEAPWLVVWACSHYHKRAPGAGPPLTLRPPKGPLPLWVASLGAKQGEES